MTLKLKFASLFVVSIIMSGCAAAPVRHLVTSTPLQQVPTEPTARPSSTPGPLELASTVFSDLYIDTQLQYSPDGRCTWDRLQAWPQEEGNQQKYEGKFYIRASLSCIRGEEYNQVNWMLVEEWNDAGLGYSIPALLGWSVDGSYLYFYDDIKPDGCQPPGGFQDNLRRVDLDSGIVRQILSGSFSGLSLSPDSSRIAYYDIQNRSIGSHTFVSGESQTYPFSVPAPVDEWWLRDLTWSPDMGSLLFVVEYGDACFLDGASIQKLDLETGNLQALFSSSDQTISIIGWNEPGRVQIWVGPDLRWLDPVSGALLP